MVGASVADIRLTGMTERTGNSKGYPYNPAKMPYYYTGIVQKISDEEFRELLGHEIPNGRWSGNLEINDAICQMYYAKSRLARLIYRCQCSIHSQMLPASYIQIHLIYRSRE